MPVILRVDSPKKTRDQLIALGFSAAQIATLAIHAVEELFTPEENAIHDEQWLLFKHEPE